MRWLACLVVLASCATTPSVVSDPAPPGGARAAVERALPLMQASQERWIKARECTSCHHQALGVSALAMARRGKLPVDEKMLARQLSRMEDRADDVDALLAGTAYINGQFGTSYHLLAAACHRIRDFPNRDVAVHYVMGKQAPDGRWPSDSHRPPLEDSPVTVTALALHALTVYGFPGRDLDQRIERARAWLRATSPATVEERVFQIFGLTWAGDAAAALETQRQALLALQRPDGGWAQLATRGSDAYATGQALVALAVAGLPVGSREYRRGVAFLLAGQEADGSWRVTSRRRVAGLPYFETGFPHGRNQFISFAGTSWAVMALMVSLDPSATEVLTGPFKADPLPAPKNLVDAALRGTDAELDRFLEGVAPGDPNLTRALFASVHDVKRVGRLLDRGAKIEGKLDGATPLFTAAGYSGAGPVVTTLLARGADPKVAVEGMSSVLWAAGPGGDAAALSALLAAGIDPNKGDELGSPLGYAVVVESEAKIDLLIEAGASVDARAIGAAVIDGRAHILERLLGRAGATPDVVIDEDERTPLHLAALLDWGDTRAVELLLAHGAKPRRRDKLGLTPLDYAGLNGNPAVETVLEKASRDRKD